MRIGILGSGNVGMSLATGFSAHGIDVMLGTRDPSKPAIVAWLDASSRAQVGSYAEAASFGEIVVTALPGRLVADIVAQLGPEPFAGRIVIDPSNPIRFTDHGPEAVYPEDDSAAEHLQRLLPKARVVKAFSQVNPPKMLDPDPIAGPRTIRICGDDANAKATVAGLLEEFGWMVDDLGPLSEAQRLERGTLNYFIRQAEKDATT